jgi:hypothetical protein
LVNRLACLTCLMLAALLAAPADGKKKPANAAGAEEFSVVGGTVFRDSGLTLGEAEVTLEVAPDPSASANPKSKIRKLKTVSSPRGEFTFRVPPVPAKYKVSVSAKGFHPADKIVEIQGASERVEATFSLSPESKR